MATPPKFGYSKSMRPLNLARYAFGYRRTLDHLRAWQLVLPPAVKEGVVSLSKQGKKHTGTRLFVHENLPQLKYHNPHVRFSVERHGHPTSSLKFTLDNGGCQSIDTTDLRPSDIKVKVAENFQQTPDQCSSS